MKERHSTDPSAIPAPAARLSLFAAIATLVLLLVLHFLSPEFDPSWRMVSEYALGKYGWVLSLMFLCWALSSWALAFAIRSQLPTRAGKIGLFLLIISGLGEALAAVFDVRHSLHGLAATLGVPTLPLAAMLIGLSLSRTQTWSPAKRGLLRASHLTWVSFVLIVVAMVVLMTTYQQAGGDMSAGGPVDTLPPGVIAFNGWANRLLILVFCSWLFVVAQQSLRLRRG